jgi:hypothetical protein
MLTVIARLLDGPLAGQTHDVDDPAPAEIVVSMDARDIYSGAKVGFNKATYRLSDEGSDDLPAYRHVPD